MAKVRVHNLAVSVDGYAAGPSQDLDNPLGVGGEGLHEWAVASRSWREAHGMDGGDTGADDGYIRAGIEGLGATIMGRNMFGPVRGEWGDSTWTGWWGDDPPFHHDVFVLTHHARDPLPMGDTTFRFVTDGPEAALEQALAAAGGADVRIGGGAATVQQYLTRGLVDELHLAIAPVLLGAGEQLLAGLGDAHALYEVTDVVQSPNVVHVTLTRRP